MDVYLENPRSVRKFERKRFAIQKLWHSLGLPWRPEPGPPRGPRFLGGVDRAERLRKPREWRRRCSVRREVTTGR